MIGIPKNYIAKAKPTNAAVLVNGKKIAFEAYGINGNNYFKLRDIAMVLNNTEKQFSVGRDAVNQAIILTRGNSYSVAGGKLEISENLTDEDATLSSNKIYLDGKEIHLAAFAIDGNNFFKLRDLGKAINFGVFWDDELKTIKIDTGSPYSG